MIAIDTNLLARFYCNDPNDPESQRQGVIAHRIMKNHAALFVSLTVLLELEWVLRGFYEQPPAEVCKVMDHLLGLANVHVEDWERVSDAIQAHRLGLDFADALHLAGARHCSEMLSFDDRKFSRKAAKHGLKPKVSVPV
jgi:predicted nucleic-acid-binding protein